MRRKRRTLAPLVILVLLVLFALASLPNLPNALAFYSENRDRLRKASFDKETVSEELKLLTQETHSATHIATYSNTAQEGNVYRINLHNTLPLPAEDRPFQEGELQFEILRE